MRDIIERLMFAGRFGHETEQQAAKRRLAAREEAAAEIARLRAELGEAQRERKALLDWMKSAA